VQTSLGANKFTCELDRIQLFHVRIIVCSLNYTALPLVFFLIQSRKTFFLEQYLHIPISMDTLILQAYQIFPGPAYRLIQAVFLVKSVRNWMMVFLRKLPLAQASG